MSSSVPSDLPASPDPSPRTNLLRDIGLAKAPPPSYSQLLQQLRAGDVKELLLSPGQRQVRVTYANGSSVSVPVFRDRKSVV